MEDPQLLREWLEYATAVRTHLCRKYRVPAGHIVLEGVVEDAVMALLGKLEKTETVDSPRAYLKRTVRNLLFKNFRKFGYFLEQALPPEYNLPEPFIIEAPPLASSAEGSPPETKTVEGPRAQFLGKVLAKLPRAVREVAELRLLHQQSRLQITTTLGCTEAVVRQYCKRAADRIKEIDFSDDEFKAAVLSVLCPRGSDKAA